jgi:acetyl-CoA decarbonylase/synthase, CODH/ACS complex subunit delta
MEEFQMSLEVPKEKFVGKTAQTVLGATPEMKGTRSKSLSIGNVSGLPFHTFEAAASVPPYIGMDVLDTLRGMDDHVKKMMGSVVNDPVAWAKAVEHEWKADFLTLKLLSANPEEEKRSPQECASLVKEVLKATKLPLIVYGSGNFETDAKLMEEVSTVGKGERMFIGLAGEDNYKSMAAAAMANGNGVVGFSNLDINLAKQISILLMDFGVKREDILVDPLQAALGVGLEYTYSVIERLRQGALRGDNALQVSIICDCTVGLNAREALDPNPKLGDISKRAVNWEFLTANTSILAGADLLIVRHPETVNLLRKSIHSLTGGA